MILFLNFVNIFVCFPLHHTLLPLPLPPSCSSLVFPRNWYNNKDLKAEANIANELIKQQCVSQN